MRSKILTFSVVSTLLIATALTAYAAPEDWYIYNGTSDNHSFSLRFPTDWTAHTMGDSIQGFGPSGDKLPAFRVEEFQGKTYADVVSFYESLDNDLISQEDVMLTELSEDLVAKRLQFNNSELDRTYHLVLIKRGNSIFSITEDSDKYPDIFKEIYSSFQFTDNWLQHIDYGEGYTFIFPDHFSINTVSGGVEVVIPAEDNGLLFDVKKYPNTNIAEAAEAVATGFEALDRTDLISFHGIPNVVEAIYSNSSSGRTFSRILIAHQGDVFSLANLNIEPDYPHLDTYEDELQEILESFEFFEIEGLTAPNNPVVAAPGSFETFPDVGDSHPNARAINSLAKLDIIDGYPTGEFQPDGLINRAELTKLLVATKLEPDPIEYANCFEDVADEWFAPAVCYAKEQGWIAGYDDDTFRPGNSVNRAEAMKIIFEVLFEGQIPENVKLVDESVLDVPADAWYRNYFALGNQLDLFDTAHTEELDGGYNFLPSEPMSRKEVAETIYRSGEIL